LLWVMEQPTPPHRKGSDDTTLQSAVCALAEG
jgi:hypothetical protein